jgi:hypothetical protein
LNWSARRGVSLNVSCGFNAMGAHGEAIIYWFCIITAGSAIGFLMSDSVSKVDAVYLSL